MTTENTAIRLSADGKSEVTGAFREIREAGEGAADGVSTGLRKMGDEAEAQFNRAERGARKAATEIETLEEKLASARRRKESYEAKASVIQGSYTQLPLFSGDPAAESAALQRKQESNQLEREKQALDRAAVAQAEAIRAVIDPLAVAQARYNSELQQAIALQMAGKLSTEDLAKYQTLLKQRLDSVATGAQGGSRAAAMLGAQFSQMGQQVAAGGNALQAVAIQLPDIAFLMGNTGKEAGKLATFFGGPWGIALTTATAVAAGLAPELLGIGDEAEKASRANETMADKLDLTKHSLDEVTAATRDYNAEQKKANQTTLESVRLIAEHAAENLNDAIAIREKIRANLDAARISAQGNAGQGTGGLAGVYGNFRVDQITAQLAAEDEKIKVLTKGARNAVVGVAEALAKIDTDPVAKIRAGFEELRKQAKASISDVDALRKRLAQLNREEEKQVQAAQKEQRDSRSPPGSGLFGREIDLNAALSIARGAGFTVTSGLRTKEEQQHLYDTVRTPENPVAKPGTSAHERGNALDIAFGKGVTPDALKKAFADEGVKLTKILKETGHYHIEWSTKTADKADREAERARQEAIRNQLYLDKENASLDAKLLQIQRAGLSDIEEIAKFDKDRVKIEEDKYKAGIEAKVKLGEIGRIDADILEKKKADIANAERAEIDRKAQVDAIRAAAAMEDAATGRKLELLQAQSGLTDTVAERRRLALEMLALDKTEKQRQYQRVIDLGAKGEASAAQVADARQGLEDLDTVYAARERTTRRQTAGPLEAYLDTMDPDTIHDRAESFAVQELDYLRQGIDDAITSKLGIKDPATKALIDLLIEQVLIRPMTEALARAAASSGGSSGSGGGLLGSLSSLVSGGLSALLGGGGLNTSGAGTSTGGFDFSAFGLTGNASGTEHFGGGYTYLNENGPELVNLPAGSKVTSAAETRRMLASANDNRALVYQNFDFTGALTTEDVLRQAEEKSRAAAKQVSDAGIAGLIDRNRRSYGQLLNTQS